MNDFEVDLAELRGLAALFRGLQAAFDQPLSPALPGGGGTPEIDDGYFSMAAHCGSRLRHLADDLAELASALEHAAGAYAGTDQNIATATANSTAAPGQQR